MWSRSNVGDKCLELRSETSHEDPISLFSPAISKETMIRDTTMRANRASHAIRVIDMTL